MIRNEAELASVLAIISDDYRAGSRFFSTHQLPEERVLADLEDPSDNPALFLTLGLVPYHVDSETGRSKPTTGRTGLWQVCGNLWRNHPWVFCPETILEEGRHSELKRLFGRLTIMDGYDADWWYRTAETLATEFDGNPRRVLEAGDHSAPRIERVVKRHQFPGLADDVSTPLWLRLMDDHVESLADLDRIDMPVDPAMVGLTNRLGETDFDPDVRSDRETLRVFWRIISRKHGFSPLRLDKPLRLLSEYWTDGGADYLSDVVTSVRDAD